MHAILFVPGVWPDEFDEAKISRGVPFDTRPVLESEEKKHPAMVCAGFVNKLGAILGAEVAGSRRLVLFRCGDASLLPLEGGIHPMHALSVGPSVALILFQTHRLSHEYDSAAIRPAGAAHIVICVVRQRIQKTTQIQIPFHGPLLPQSGTRCKFSAAEAACESHGTIAEERLTACRRCKRPVS
ncbi:MAG: hypothetical protein ABI318_05735 [Chthoniobacteraceae bacterium]